MAGKAQTTAGPLVRRGGGAVRYSDLEYRLLRLSGQAIGDFELIEPQDRILVALSGGPASTALCALLEQHRRRFHFGFELVPFHLEEKKGSSRILGELLRAWGLRLESKPAPEFSGQKGRPLTERCRRRGFALRQAARRFGCNKLADGLLLDDFLEQLLDSALRLGRLAAISVRKSAQDGIAVIRPLVYIERSQAKAYAAELGLRRRLHPPRPADAGLDYARRLIGRMQAQIPRLKENMLGALRRVRESHLLAKGRESSCCPPLFDSRDAFAGRVEESARPDVSGRAASGGGKEGIFA